MKASGDNEDWPNRWNARVAWSATVHLAHSAAILALTLFVPDRAGFWLRCVWGVGAFFSASALLLLLRVGSYQGTTDEEIGSLIRRSYWTATALYLGLLAVSLFFIVGSRR